MKRNLIVTALVTGVLFASVFADDGKINFGASAITDDTCTEVNNMSNPWTVTLGTVSNLAFTAAGNTVAPTKFSVLLKDGLSSFKYRQQRYLAKCVG